MSVMLLRRKTVFTLLSAGLLTLLFYYCNNPNLNLNSFRTDRRNSFNSDQTIFKHELYGPVNLINSDRSFDRSSGGLIRNKNDPKSIQTDLQEDIRAIIERKIIIQNESDRGEVRRQNSLSTNRYHGETKLETKYARDTKDMLTKSSNMDSLEADDYDDELYNVDTLSTSAILTSSPQKKYETRNPGYKNTTKKINAEEFSVESFEIIKYDNVSKIPKPTVPAGTHHLPDVLVIGAKKSGTRALLEFLRLHPMVKAAKQELHFFDRHYHKGVQWYRSKLPTRMPGELTIEKTPAYFVSPQVPGRVRELIPHARLLLVVREPATRALSDYTQGVSKHSPRKNFSDLVFADHKTGLINVNWGPVVTGLYARHLQRWLHYFPIDSIHVVDGENLVLHPAQEMAKVEIFLHLKAFISPHHFVFNKTKGFPCIVREEYMDSQTTHAFAHSSNSSNPQSNSAPSVPSFSFNAASSQMFELNSHSSVDFKPPVGSSSKIHCLGSSKGRDHPDVDPEAFRILKEFYRPFNHKFFRMIGQTFKW